MNDDKLIVVAGGGGKLGRLVVEALLENPSTKVRALVRDTRKPEAAAMARDRVELAAFDAATADDAARADAVHGAFAVVSTLQGGPDVIIDAHGKTPLDWTTWEDTARFTAAAALDEREVPQHLFVVGERADAHTFAERWRAARGEQVELERLGSLAELEAETHRRLAAEPGNMYAWLPLMYARGVFGGQALLGPAQNARYPAIAAETLAHAFARGAI